MQQRAHANAMCSAAVVSAAVGDGRGFGSGVLAATVRRLRSRHSGVSPSSFTNAIQSGASAA